MIGPENLENKSEEVGVSREGSEENAPDRGKYLVEELPIGEEIVLEGGVPESLESDEQPGTEGIEVEELPVEEIEIKGIPQKGNGLDH